MRTGSCLAEINLPPVLWALDEDLPQVPKGEKSNFIEQEIG